MRLSPPRYLAPRLRRLLWAGAMTALLLTALLALHPAAAAPLGSTALLRLGDGRSTPYDLRPGELITLPVTLSDAANVGTASAVVQFDPAVLSPVACKKAPGSAFGSGTCNLHFAANAVKFNALAAAGVNGEQALYQITWQVHGPVGSHSNVTPTSAQLATPQGQALPVDTAGSQVDVVGGVAGEDGRVSIGESGHGPYVLRPGETFALSVTLAITGAHTLSALDLLLHYDPAVVHPRQCRIASPLMGACNPNFDPDQGWIKLNLVSASGLHGIVPAFDIRFLAAPDASPGALSELEPVIDHATGAHGEPLYLLPIAASITLGQPAGQTPHLWVGPPQGNGAFSTSMGITTTVPVWMSQVSDLGAAALNLSYDPAIVRAVGCRVRQDARLDWGVCALHGDHVRVSLISTLGIGGDRPLFDLLLTPAVAAAVGESSPLTLTVRSFDDTAAIPLPVRTHPGSVTIDPGSGPGVALLRLGDAANSGQYDLPASGEVETAIRIEGATNLGAISIVLHYQPQVVQPLACNQSSAFGSGICNLQAGPGEIRLNAVSLGGVNGDLTLATVRWQAASSATPGDTSDIQLSPTTFADPSGHPLPVQTAGGDIDIVPPAATGNELVLRLGEGPGYITPGNSLTLPLLVAPGPGMALAAATFLLHYNPAVLQLQNCQIGAGNETFAGFCNPTFAPDQIKFNILSATGISEETQVATFTFTALALSGQRTRLGPAGQDAGLVLEAVYLATTGGHEPSATIQSWPLLVTGPDDDADGISSDIENNAPGNGDGNHDGIPDANQANVTSMPNAVDGSYVTLASPPGISIEDARALAAPLPQSLPVPVDFPQGVFSFALDGLSPGQSLTLKLILPPTGPVVHDYFKYGAEPGNPDPHWYNFAYDGQTGAEFQGDTITLHLRDGGRGDDDQRADGRFVDPGGPALAPGQAVYRLFWPRLRR